MRIKIVGFYKDGKGIPSAETHEVLSARPSGNVLYKPKNQWEQVQVIVETVPPKQEVEHA